MSKQGGLRQELNAKATVTPQELSAPYLLALSRSPTAEETTQAEGFLRSVREAIAKEGKPPNEADQEVWRAFARVVFRLNEFCYLD